MTEVGSLLSTPGLSARPARVFEAFDYLAKDRGPLKGVVVDHYATPNEVVFMFRENREYRVVPIEPNDCKEIYGLLLDYVKKFGYREHDIFCELTLGGFRKTTDDLKCDLGLFEPEPPMPAPLDLNREADKLGVSRAAALKAIRRAAAEEATADAAKPRSQPKAEQSAVPDARELFGEPPPATRPAKYSKSNFPPEWFDSPDIVRAARARAREYVSLDKSRLETAEIDRYRAATRFVRAYERRQARQAGASPG